MFWNSFIFLNPYAKKYKAYTAQIKNSNFEKPIITFGEPFKQNVPHAVAKTAANSPLFFLDWNTVK